MVWIMTLVTYGMMKIKLAFQAAQRKCEMTAFM